MALDRDLIPPSLPLRRYGVHLPIPLGKHKSPMSSNKLPYPMIFRPIPHHSTPSESATREFITTYTLHLGPGVFAIFNGL
jgi:hypothetical protein